jgi:hypothetical protein
VGLDGADGTHDPHVCTAGSAFPIVQKTQHLPDVFVCYALYFCIHVVCHGAGHLHVDGADYEIHGDVPFDRCSGVARRGAFVHMFQDDEVKYGDNVADDFVESDYVVHGDTVVLGSVVQAEYLVQPACVVHVENMIGDDEVQSDYVVPEDDFAVQIGSVIPGDNVVQYDDVHCC